MRYLQMEAELRTMGWFYCGAGVWRRGERPDKLDLLTAYRLRNR